MPFMRSSGVPSAVPGRTATRSVRRATVSVRTYSRRPAGGSAGSLVEDIGPRRVGQHLQLAAAQLPGRRDLLAGPLTQPVHIVRPPRALDRLRGAEPLLR